MLRIDVNVPVANSNGMSSRHRIHSSAAGRRRSERNLGFGLRNPWRYSFDLPSRGGTGAIIIGDVGQGAWEEVDYEPAGRGGRNYGLALPRRRPLNVTSVAPVYNPPGGLTDPIGRYSHSVGQSITGGFVYRGSSLPATFRGRYFFADYVQGRVWSMVLTINPTTGEATRQLQWSTPPN